MRGRGKGGWESGERVRMREGRGDEEGEERARMGVQDECGKMRREEEAEGIGGKVWEECSEG